MKNIIIIFILIAFISCKKNNDIKLIPIKSGDKWGYIDKQGKFIINTQFEEAHLFRDGLALVKSNENKFGFIGIDGKYVINPTYKSANSFSEELACVISENSKPQFINKEGKIIFTVDADACGGFSEGMAPFKIKGKWGYIDKDGTIKINPLYENANMFSEGLAAVSKIDTKTKQKKWGFINKEGEIKIDFQFIEDTINSCAPSYFSEGLSFVSNDGNKWGFINKEGNYEINPQFDGWFNLDLNFEDKGEYKFKNGKAAIKQGETWGYIDKSGKYIINPQFLSVQDFTSSGNAAVQGSDKKYGFIDNDGKYIVNPQFDNVKLGYVSDFAVVQSSDKYGILNENGTYIVNPQFDDVWICNGCWLGIQYSDYVDYETLANNFFENSNEEQIRNISNRTTMQDILGMYPKTSMDDLNAYDLKIKKPDLNMNNELMVAQANYYFSDKTYTDIPIYKIVKKYNVWSESYYNDRVIDYYDKKYNDNAKVTGASFIFAPFRIGVGNSKKLAEELKNIAINKLKMQPKSLPAINNIDKNGLFILTNENMLLDISYYNDKIIDEKTITPYLMVLFVNKNYHISFEEEEKSLVDNFTERNR